MCTFALFFFIRVKQQKAGGSRKKKRVIDDEDDNDEHDCRLECLYEDKLAELQETSKNVKLLLPFKTIFGIQPQSREVEDEVDDYGVDEDVPEIVIGNKDTTRTPREEKTFQNAIFTHARLVAQRRAALLEYKLRIGTLASGFLEDPEHRVNHYFF